MALERWRPKSESMTSPFRELARLGQEMEEFFGRGFPLTPWRFGRDEIATPAVDIVDRKEELVVRADLPGLEEKDIEVSVQDGMLTIRGERKEEKTEKDEYYRSERWFGACYRGLPLPSGVDADTIKATFKNGVLEVHLPKTAEAKAKKIEVKAA